MILTGSFVAMLVIWAISRTIDRGRFGRGIILETQLGKGRFDVVPTATPEDAIPVDSIGHAETPLRPAGRVRFDDRLLDAVSLGRWIEAGAEVRVVRTGLVLEVEATDS